MEEERMEARDLEEEAADSKWDLQIFLDRYQVTSYRAI